MFKKSQVKFDLLADLGIITVPKNYDPATRLSRFEKDNCEEFFAYHRGITDANFPNPSYSLKPGNRPLVKAFKQIGPGTTTSRERMDFLRSLGAVFPGAQGLSLAFEQLRGKLPEGHMWYASFDKPERLWKDSEGFHEVPCVFIASDPVGFGWYLTRFEEEMSEKVASLCFTEE